MENLLENGGECSPWNRSFFSIMEKFLDDGGDYSPRNREILSIRAYMRWQPPPIAHILATNNTKILSILGDGDKAVEMLRQMDADDIGRIDDTNGSDDTEEDIDEEEPEEESKE